MKNWNAGKAQEFKDRKTYVVDGITSCTSFKEDQQPAVRVEETKPVNSSSARKYLLFTTPTCPNCRIIEKFLDEHHVDYEIKDALENKDLTRKYGILQAPTMVVESAEGAQLYVNTGSIMSFINQSKGTAA